MHIYYSLLFYLLIKTDAFRQLKAVQVSNLYSSKASLFEPIWTQNYTIKKSTPRHLYLQVMLWKGGFVFEKHLYKTEIIRPICWRRTIWFIATHNIPWYVPKDFFFPQHVNNFIYLCRNRDQCVFLYVLYPGVGPFTVLFCQNQQFKNYWSGSSVLTIAPPNLRQRCKSAFYSWKKEMQARKATELQYTAHLSWLPAEVFLKHKKKRNKNFLS